MPRVSPPAIAAMQIGGPPRDAAGDAEHDGVQQRVRAQRRDDRVEPEQADEHAVDDAGHDRDDEAEEQRRSSLAVVARRACAS